MIAPDVDRLGRDCADTFPDPSGRGRVPVLDPAHKWAMIRFLYAGGWSYHLIAQLCGMDPAQMREALASDGASLGVPP